MSFLNDLSNQISNQFSLGENSTHTLDGIVDGQQTKYGALGDFASKFDQSAQRSYLEEGYLRRDPYNSDPKQMEILLQEPEATILIKKRMFSSVAENFRPDFMDSDEKLYYKAMNILFQNKCNQIAALEKLSKIQKITAAVGQIDNQLVPWIITLADTVNNSTGSDSLFGGIAGAASGTNPFTTQNTSDFTKVVDRLRTLYAYNQTSQYTNWITNATNLFQSTLGQGTGVIEITNFTSLNTNTSVDIKSPGNFNFNISDPYEAMLITDYDIEKALSDATNGFYSKKSFQFGLMSAEQVIADQQHQLNLIRERRKASPLTFKIDPNTMLGKRVTVIIDNLGIEIQFTYDSTGGTGFPGLGGAGNSVSITKDYLKGGDIAGFDGLDTSSAPMGPDSNIKRLISQSELSIFQNLIAAIYNKLQLMANSAGALSTNMQLTNYARKKLRFNFSGQLIIQPMDTVHIYVNSKSRYDNKVLAGLQQMFSGVGILQNLNNTLVDLTNNFDAFFRPSGSIPLQVEKSVYVGSSFPNYLWSLMRKQFVTEKEGTHVFAGVVESASDNWSDGKFTIDISGKDNTFYFEQGKVNFKPGVDAFNGAFFDPLTPFKSKFDTIDIGAKSNTQELLNENKVLLSDSAKLSLVKSKLGPYAGEKVTQSNYIQDRSIDPVTGRLTKVFYAPDGLVYKWKEGIGVFTQFGGSINLNDPNLVGNFNTFAEPFAGLDVMNVLSLLITGIPYNFATYYKTTTNLYGFSGDPQSKQDAAYSFTNSLRNDLAKRNVLWGNFIPFKNLVMDESTLSQAMKAQLTISKKNNDLDQKLKQLSELGAQAAMKGTVNALATQFTGASGPLAQAAVIKVDSQIKNLTQEINSIISGIQNETNQFSQQNNGLDVTFDTNQLIDGKSDPSNAKLRRHLRKQINYLTRRMSYDIRGNQDKNLFIVDDYYDVDYDIAAFNQALADGVRLYNNEYTSVRDKIINVADLLNLEVFCDTQGHIRVRQPQYNRMPSSVFYRMMYLKQTLGVKIFPQFLDDMFGNQLDSLKSQIEILEDEIRLDCAILGHKSNIDSDEDATEFININSLISNTGGMFHFISRPTGVISDINDLIQQANQDIIDGQVTQGLTDYSKIKSEGTSTKNIFSNVQRYSILFDALQAQIQRINQGSNVTNPTDLTPLDSSVVQQLITRINTKSGQRLTNKDYIVSRVSPDAPVQAVSDTSSESIDFFKVTKEITDYITKWQSAVKLFYHTIKNSVEYKSLDNDSSTGNRLLTPGIFGNSHIPEVFEHMIEDESYDDYGLGSGKRFIIKRSQIKNLKVYASPPPYTSVEVHGTLNTFAPNAVPEGLNSFPSGGNGIVTAFAIDYDLWRNYGFKTPAKLDLPFLSDPESQCAPYAAMVLSRNRSEIFKASVTISGNEFMQPGEVVYLQDRQMLFYVSNVRHSFQEGSSFTTSMELNYGHTPGQYIPTYLDVFGKLIYKNRDIANTIVQRQDSSGPDTNVGIIQLPSSGSDSAFSIGQENQKINPVATSNTTVLNNILYNTAYIINANNSKGNNVSASVEIRIYYDDASGGADTKLLNFAQDVKDILTGKKDGPKLNPSGQNGKNAFLKSENVNFVKINMDNASDRRSPSQKAIDTSRNLANTISVSNGPKTLTPNDVIRKALFSYIVDCWVTINHNKKES